MRVLLVIKNDGGFLRGACPEESADIILFLRRASLRRRASWRVSTGHLILEGIRATWRVCKPRPTPKLLPRTPNSELRTPNSEPRTPNSEPRTPNSELRTPNSELRTPNPELRTPNSELRTPNSELRTPNPELRTPNSELRTPNPEPFRTPVNIGAFSHHHITTSSN